MLEDDFSDIIKKARHGLGLKPDQVAGTAHVPPSVLRELERGRRPQRDEVLAIASALNLDGAKLASIACDGWTPPPVTPAGDMVMTIHGEIGGYAVKGYVLHDPDTRDAVLIDTGYSPDAVLEYVERERLRLTAVCLTHGHLDHAGGLDLILSRHSVPVYLGEQDWGLLSWQPPMSVCRFVKDGERLQVGHGAITFLTTPGHTPGGVCYRGIDSVFVGDTLFAGSIGRANPPTLYSTHLKSVRERLLTLPDHTALFPGHGPATTAAEEQAHNPFG
jgi:hydroxyacylglutathione hydrolase